MTTFNPDPLRTYPSLRDFYSDRGGLSSPESDYGHFNWNDSDLPECRYCLTTPWNCPAHRLTVSHVHDTGDFYATTPAGTGQTILFAKLSTGPTLLQAFQHHIADWAHADQPGRPLSWFRHRILEFNTLHHTTNQTGHNPDPQPNLY